MDMVLTVLFPMNPMFLFIFEKIESLLVSRPRLGAAAQFHAWPDLHAGPASPALPMPELLAHHLAPVPLHMH